MRINYNINAARANNTLLMHENKMSKTMNRLSSGQKISVSDAPSYYAIAGKLNLQIGCTKVAKDSSVDGISVIHIADGVLNEITGMTQRLNELAIQASQELLSVNDREILNNEAKSLMDEIQRMADTTQFNDQNLLDGTFDNKAYIKVAGQNNSNFKVLDISDNFEAGNFTIKNGKIYKEDKLYLDGTSKLGNDNILTISDSAGREIKIKTDGTIPDMDLEVPGIGPMTLQIGPNQGDTLDIRIPQVSIMHLGLSNFDLVNNPNESITYASNALKVTTDIRGRLGAYENRLEHIGNKLDVSEESITASYSKIMDTDIAEEMVNFSTQQILIQATMQVLTQINQQPEKVLQLLS